MINFIVVNIPLIKKFIGQNNSSKIVCKTPAGSIVVSMRLQFSPAGSQKPPPTNFSCILFFLLFFFFYII